MVGFVDDEENKEEEEIFPTIDLKKKRWMMELSEKKIRFFFDFLMF